MIQNSKKIIKGAFSQHVVRTLSCNYDSGDLRPHFSCIKTTICFLNQQSSVFALKEKRSQGSTHPFNIK